MKEQDYDSEKDLDLEDYEDDDELDWYDEELLDYVREETKDMERINDLLDQDLLYLFELWDEYTAGIEGEEEEVEIDIDDLYQFVLKTAAEDEQDIDISQEDLVCLLYTSRCV